MVVYDARSGRSRGFGFVTMRDVEGASAAIEALNGKDLHGRRIRVDFSTTHKPHDPTPGIYKGEVRPDDRYRAPPGGPRDGPRDGRRGEGSRYTGRGYDRAGPSSYRDSGRGGDSYRVAVDRGATPIRGTIGEDALRLLVDPEGRLVQGGVADTRGRLAREGAVTGTTAALTVSTLIGKTVCPHPGADTEVTLTALPVRKTLSPADTTKLLYIVNRLTQLKILVRILSKIALI